MSAILAIEGLDARHGLLQAVRNVSFTVSKGEIVTFVGANGAGKTTLLRAVAGAHRLHGGRILFRGEDIAALPDYERVKLGIALVPEGRRLFPQMTLRENLTIAGAVGRPGRWKLDSVLALFPNLSARLDSKAAVLSGGEQQATAIGRALMTNPEVVLLDEISLGLSPAAVGRVYESLKTLIATGATILMVEQDLQRALSVAHRVICMLEGAIVVDAPVAQVSRERITEAYFGLRGAGRGEAGA